MVKNLPASAGNTGSVLGWGTKTPHDSEQLSLCTTATEACMPGAHALQQEKPLQKKPMYHNYRVTPTLPNYRKPAHSNKDPAQPKINTIF